MHSSCCSWQFLHVIDHQRQGTMPHPRDVTRFAVYFREERDLSSGLLNIARITIHCRLCPYVVLDDCTPQCLHCCLEWVTGEVPIFGGCNKECTLWFASCPCTETLSAHHRPLELSWEKWDTMLHAMSSSHNYWYYTRNIYIRLHTLSCSVTLTIALDLGTRAVLLSSCLVYDP